MIAAQASAMQKTVMALFMVAEIVSPIPPCALISCSNSFNQWRSKSFIPLSSPPDQKAASLCMLWSIVFLKCPPFSSVTQHLCYDGCLEITGEIIRTCVLKLCTVISTLRWAVLTVLWIGLCLTGPISLCLDSFVFMFVFFHVYLVILHMFCIIVTRQGGPGQIEA